MGFLTYRNIPNNMGLEGVKTQVGYDDTMDKNGKPKTNFLTIFSDKNPDNPKIIASLLPLIKSDKDGVVEYEDSIDPFNQNITLKLEQVNGYASVRDDISNQFFNNKRLDFKDDNNKIEGTCRYVNAFYDAFGIDDAETRVRSVMYSMVLQLMQTNIVFNTEFQNKYNQMVDGIINRTLDEQDFSKDDRESVKGYMLGTLYESMQEIKKNPELNEKLSEIKKSINSISITKSGNNGLAITNARDVNNNPISTSSLGNMTFAHVGGDGKVKNYNCSIERVFLKTDNVKIDGDFSGSLSFSVQGRENKLQGIANNYAFINISGNIDTLMRDGKIEVDLSRNSRLNENEKRLIMQVAELFATRFKEIVDSQLKIILAKMPIAPAIEEIDEATISTRAQEMLEMDEYREFTALKKGLEPPKVLSLDEYKKIIIDEKRMENERNADEYKPKLKEFFNKLASHITSEFSANDRHQISSNIADGIKSLFGKAQVNSVNIKNLLENTLNSPAIESVTPQMEKIKLTLREYIEATVKKAMELAAEIKGVAVKEVKASQPETRVGDIPEPTYKKEANYHKLNPTESKESKYIEHDRNTIPF